MIPGRKPRRVSRIFSQKAGLIPIVRKTPSGGRIMDNIRRIMLIGV